MTITEKNKALAARWLDLVGARKIEELCEMTDPDWTMSGGPPDLSSGHAGVKELFSHIGPIEQTWTIEDLIAEGDKVVVRALNSCVQESFFGLPGRHRRQTFSAVFIFEVKGGKVLRTWRHADDLGRIFQLGGRIEAGN